MAAVSFEEYVASLGRLSGKIDPTASTPAAEEIKKAAASLEALSVIDPDTVLAWALAHPDETYVLALVVGLSREKLANHLRHWFGIGAWRKATLERGPEFIAKLDEEFDLIRLLRTQRGKSYSFEDVLVARGGSRVTATSAGVSGRKIEDEIEAIARDLHLPYAVRTRFAGRGDQTAPADLTIPAAGKDCVIAVAAKGFDSTGSKLTDAVREIEEMAATRTGNQVALAVVDGIGWKGRRADLKRIWELWDSNRIDGLYTLASLDQFRTDLDKYATWRGIARV
jgi:hypothetical protein